IWLFCLHLNLPMLSSARVRSSGGPSNIWCPCSFPISSLQNSLVGPPSSTAPSPRPSSSMKTMSSFDSGSKVGLCLCSSTYSSISSWSGLDGLNEGLWDGEGAGENMGAGMGEEGAGEQVVIVVGGEGAGENMGAGMGEEGAGEQVVIVVGGEGAGENMGAGMGEEGAGEQVVIVVDGGGAGENMGAGMGEEGAGEQVVIVVGGEGAGEKVVDALDWPVYNPDLSPSDNVAHIRRCLQKEWDSTTHETISLLLSSGTKTSFKLVNKVKQKRSFILYV
ncbi:hypothetical protein AMEX_G27907, partial [Astyanax mexicanus]